MPDIVMPRLSDSMEEGTVVRWLKAPGDQVRRGEPIVEIETDKATITYESDADGVLSEILIPDGETVSIGTTIARIAAEGEAPAAQQAQQPQQAQAQGEQARPALKPPQQAMPQQPQAPVVQERVEDFAPAEVLEDSTPQARAKASPIARRLARKLGVDVSTVQGTGPGGRVVKEDVEAAAAAAGGALAEGAPQQAQAQQAQPPQAGQQQEPGELVREQQPPQPQPPQPPQPSQPAPPQPPPAPQAPPVAPPPQAQPQPAPAQTAAGSGWQQPPMPQLPPMPAPPIPTPVSPPPMPPQPPVFSPQQTGQYPSVPGMSQPGYGGQMPPQQIGAMPQQPYPGQQPQYQQPVAPAGPKGQVTTTGLSSAQQTIARRMSESKATAPEFFVEVEVDMSRAMLLREQLKMQFDPTPTYNDMVVQATALALRQHPRVNGAYRDGRFEYYSDVNVGVVVAAAETLMVPTIPHVDQKGLSQIARETRDLANAVRGRTIQPAQIAGGTFTISNLGMYGVERFTAVINPPQAGIIAVGAIRNKPIVAEDGVSLAVRPMMSLVMSCDHRILYGADGAEFLNTVKAWLESAHSLPL